MNELFRCSNCGGFYFASPTDPRFLCRFCARATLHKVMNVTQEMQDKITFVFAKQFDAPEDSAYLLITVSEHVVMGTGFYPGCRHRLDAYVAEQNPDLFHKVKEDLVRGVVHMLLTGTCQGNFCGRSLTPYHHLVFETNDESLIPYVSKIVMPEIRRMKIQEVPKDRKAAEKIFNQKTDDKDITWN